MTGERVYSFGTTLRDDTGHRWSTVAVSPNIIDASYNTQCDSLIYQLHREGAVEPTGA